MLAHHVTAEGKRSLMVLAPTSILSQRPTCVLFAERRIYVDWIEQRALS